MTANVDIVNDALIRLGDTEQLTSLPQTGSKLASLANNIFDRVRQQELRKYAWNFARERVEISKDATDPTFGRAYRYLLPTGFMRVAPDPDGRGDDWQIEGDYLLSDDRSPLQFSYIKDHTDPDDWDPLFTEVMICRIAMLLAPVRSASRTKTQDLKVEYMDCIAKAKAVNAIDNSPVDPPEDYWISVRST